MKFCLSASALAANKYRLATKSAVAGEIERRIEVFRQAMRNAEIKHRPLRNMVARRLGGMSA